MCKCNGTCIYFPKIDNELKFYYDKNGVKRIINSSKYKCLYNDKDIDFKKNCKYFKNYSDVRRKLFE